jgi:LPXTG-motif cell wall-anchored protein
MLFAMFWERMVWGTSPGWLSIAGSALILGSALYVGTRKQQKKVKLRADEEVGFMERRSSFNAEETVAEVARRT